MRSQNGCLAPQKMKSSIKDFFSKWDQISTKLRIWSHLLKKSLMENFIFCAVSVFVIIKCNSFSAFKTSGRRKVVKLNMNVCRDVS